MAKKKFLVNIDLNLNQLINSRAENGTGFITGGINSQGRLMYDTSTSRVLYDTGVAIETIANLNDVTGLLDFKGGYNALTNTPNLVNPPSGTTFKGDYYIVTVAGTFYGVLLEIGDSLFASVDNPTTIDGWVIVQANVVYATETIAGIILLATQEEVNTGTNNSKAITPLTLATYVTNNKQNIYNIDGTLTANRTITLADKNLTFTGVGNNIFQFNINNGVQYSQTSLNANLINSSIYNDALQLNSATTVQNGVVSLKVYNDVLTVDRSLVVNSFGTRINSSYYLPNTDGTAGQVMITDGSGNLSFGNGVLGSGATNSLAFWSSTSTVSFDVLLRRGTSGGNAFIQVLGADADVTIGNGSVASGVDIRSNLNGLLSIYSYGFGSSGLSFQRRRGTKSAPTEALSGDTLGNIQFNNVGVVQVKATENATSGWGNTVTFYTGVQGTTTQQEVLRLTNDKKVKISNAFFLPNTDGTAGQVMTTDGAGNVSWGNTSSTNIYNTNGTLTANRILTFADKNLTFTGNGGQVTIFQYDPITEGGASISQTLTQNLIQVSNGSSALLSQVVVGQFNIANTVSNDTNSTSINQTNSFVETQILDTFNTNVAFRIIIGASGLNINNAYTLPKVDGTAFQVLGTNGSGVVTWQNVATPSPINIYNTDGTLTANRTISGNAKILTWNNLRRNVFNIIPVLNDTVGFVINIEAGSLFPSTIGRMFTIVDTSTTNERFGINVDGNVVISNAYTLPITDGTVGQVLSTNGFGIITWQTVATPTPINIYNTDGQLTANRNLDGNTKTLDIYNVSSFTVSVVPLPVATFGYQINVNSTGMSGSIGTRIFNIIDSNGTLERFGITRSGNVRINNAFYFPLIDGTAGQVLQTNGSGSVTWGTISSTNIYNTDGTLTANRTISGNAKTLNFDNVSSFTVSIVPLSVATFGYQINVNSTGMSGSIGTRIFNIIDSNGTLERFGITRSGNVRINNAFSFPLIDGTAGQVLQTNGSGSVTWGTSSSTNIYNTDGTLTANRTLTVANFNLIFSGLGTSGSTQFTRSNGGGTQSSITTTYNSLSLNSSNGTDISSFSTTPTQNYASVSDFSDNSTQIQQLSTEIRLLVQDSVGVLNSLTVKNNGININSAYTLPKTAGTSGQILVIDGSGNVNWTSSGIGTSDIWKSNPNETYRGVSFNNNSTTVVTDGGVILSVSASTLAQSVASTNFATKQIRLRYYASVVSAGRYTGLRGTALLWFMQGGFRFVCDFNISDTAYSSGTQQFFGMASSTADLNYGTVSGFLVSSLINIIGVGNDTGDANLQIFHNDATGTATKIDLGASFPANRTSLAISTTVYEIQLINLPATLTVQYRVINKETGAIATGTLATNLPDASLGLNFFASRCMSTLSSVTNSGQFDCSKVGVYSML